MVKLFNDDVDLYKPDRVSYTNSLSFAKNLPIQTNDTLIFHCLWKVPKEFGRKQLAVLKSIIVAHCNKLDNLQINLWSNVDLTENIYFKEVSEYVSLKKWSIEEESKDTILSDFFTESTINDDLCYLEGDLFRLLILHKYGGFYIDMDVLVLEDMSPLNHLEFLYQWGTSGFHHTKPILDMNGAVMRLNKSSLVSLEFLEILKNTPPQRNTTCWGNSMYSNVRKNTILALPGVWFNSEWGFEGTTNNPFEKHDNIDLFDGAFTWHWHNRWDAEIQTGSKFWILENNINNKFNNIKK